MSKYREVPLMPRLGSFELYTMVPEGAAATGPVSEFYWRDKRHPTGQGPFVSLWACVENFKNTVSKVSTLPQTTSFMPVPLQSVLRKDTVVNIDFVLKRRL